WILEIRDLWPESIVAVGAITNRPVIHLLEGMELFAYRKADHLIVVTDAFKAHMLKRGIVSKKVTVIKNGVDFSLYKKPLHGSRDLSRELGLEDKFVASYFGTHGMAHHLETVLEAAHELREWKDIVFLLVGDGAERSRLVTMRNEMKLSNVVLLDQQPKKKMPELWSLSSVSVVLLKKSALFKTVIPSKIVESMAMERPVILGVEGESAELVLSAGGGICIEPESSKDLAIQVLKLYRDPMLRQELGSSGRRYVLEHFDRQVLARRFADVMTLVCL
ncbi:MAG: glycosyltransferase family 4 protein, partial [Nitrospirales bacterium]